jgi:hypothetical protein
MTRSLLYRLATLGLLLSFAACAGLPLQSSWSIKAPAETGEDDTWDEPKPLLLQDVDVRARNDGQYLYLRLASITEHVKDQWMGVYGQSLLLLFDPTGRAPQRQGLRLTLLPPAGLRPPWDPHNEPEYVWRSDDRVELVRRDDQGAYQPQPIRQQDASWEIHFKGQILVYQVRIPLQQAHGWNLGLAPGRSVGLRIRTTDIDPHVAMEFRGAQDHRVPSTGFRNSSLSMTNVAATGDSLTAADGSTYSPGGSTGSIHQTVPLSGNDPGVAEKKLAPYPAPVNVPDPIDLDLLIRLASAP